MGQSLSSTRFVGDGHRVAAQSFQPCHLFGDSTIYGLGIRLGFYIQYFAAIVAMLTGYTDGLRGVRMGLAILVIGLFITLLVNSTGRGLVLLDWYIVMTLMGKYVFFSDIFVRVAATKVALERRGRKHSKGKKDVVAEILDSGSTDGDDAERARRRELLQAALGVHRAHYAVEDASKHDDADELMALRGALAEFERAVRDAPNLQPGYTRQRVGEMTQHRSAFRQRAFSDDFVSAAETYGMSHAQAAKADKQLRRAALSDHKAAASRETVAEIQEGLQANRPLDMLTIGVICVSWAAFQFVRPWLYWDGIDRGKKEGCDVKLLWMFVPASIYDKPFRSWLKTWTVFMVILGVFYLLYGLFIIATNMFRAREWFERQRPDSDVESQRGLLGGSGGRSSGSRSDGGRSRSSGRRSEDVAGSGPVRERRKYKHRRAGRGRRKLFRIIGGIQLALLAITMAITEGTIALNDLDMTSRHMRTSAELFAFFVALVTAVPVFWECLVIAPLRSYLRRKKGGEDWERGGGAAYEEKAAGRRSSADDGPTGSRANP